MTINILSNNMACLFCGTDTAPNTMGGGYTCQNQHCKAWYFNNGIACLEMMPEHQPKGQEIMLVQELNHGCLWSWCKQHQEYEREDINDTACALQTARMTLQLSG